MHLQSRLLGKLHTKFVKTVQQQLDPGDSERLQDPPNVLSSAITIPTFKVVNECDPTCWRGAQQATTEGCSCSSGTAEPWILLTRLHSSKKEWRTMPHHQSEGAEPIGSPCPLQDGEHPATTGYASPQGLDGEDRPEKSLLLCPHSSTVTRPPQTVVGWQALQVHMPALWTIQCSQDVHKTPQTSSGFSPREGCPSDYIY